MKKREFFGLSCSSKVVVPLSSLKTCFVRKQTLAFSPSEPKETLSNNSGFTFSQLIWKQMQSMLWKAPPITKKARRWTTIWTTSRLSQMVTYYLWWVLWYFKEFKNTKLDKWQKMLLSLRSNPQTMSPYIQNCDSLYTRTDHYMLLPIVLHMVVPLCYE